MVGLVQVTRPVNPLCHPSARFEDVGNQHMVASKLVREGFGG